MAPRTFTTHYPFAPGVLQRGARRARRAQRKLLWGAALALLGMVLAVAALLLGGGTL